MADYTTNTGEFINSDEAATMTARYRTKYPGKVRAIYLGSAKLQDLLAQTDVVGLRIYQALDADLKNAFVVVGTKANGDDVLSLILDRGLACPTACSTPNILNSEHED